MRCISTSTVPLHGPHDPVVWRMISAQVIMEHLGIFDSMGKCINHAQFRRQRRPYLATAPLSRKMVACLLEVSTKTLVSVASMGHFGAGVGAEVVLVVICVGDTFDADTV